jgi:hypothetical protein
MAVTLRDTSIVDLVSQLEPLFMRARAGCDTCDSIFYISESKRQKSPHAGGWPRYTDFTVIVSRIAAIPLWQWSKAVTLNPNSKPPLLSL